MVSGVTAVRGVCVTEDTVTFQLDCGPVGLIPITGSTAATGLDGSGSNVSGFKSRLELSESCRDESEEGDCDGGVVEEVGATRSGGCVTGGEGTAISLGLVAVGDRRREPSPEVPLVRGGPDV